MKVQKIRTIRPTLTSTDNPYLQKAWVPNYEEFDVVDLQSIEGIPEDIEGVYLRNTENQIHEPIGRIRKQVIFSRSSEQSQFCSLGRVTGR